MTRNQLKCVMQQFEFSILEIMKVLSEPQQEEECKHLEETFNEMENLLHNIQKELPYEENELNKKPVLYLVK